MATTLLVQDEVKKEFDTFAVEWGKYGESHSDILRRMVRTLTDIDAQKVLKQLEEDVKK